MSSRCHINFLVTIIIGFLISGCAATSKIPAPQHPLQPATSLPELRGRLDAILTDAALARSTAGVKIVSLQTGEVVYEHNSHLLFHPASNEKLITSAAALSLLGPNFKFVTTVACDSAARQDSVIHGNVYLIGRGNPDLKTGDLFALAQELAQNGIREVRGNLVCDDYYFDDVRWASGWMWDDDPSDLWSRITALTINDNAVIVKVRPGSRVGEIAAAQFDGDYPHLSLINTSVTVARKSEIDSLDLVELNISRRWQQGLNTYVVDGAMGMDEPAREEKVNTLEPELLAGYLFKSLLQQAGIRAQDVVQRGLSPSRIESLAEHRMPLLPVLINMNKVSDNLSAELLLKTIAAECGGRPGTGDKGMRIIRRFLMQSGVDTVALRLADGSGVSRYNLVTPGGIVDLLIAMWRNFKVRNEFISTLPIAGVDGTLGRRMKGTAAEGVLHAKTGTLSGVSTLSGFSTTADGEELAFSMMIQHYLGSDAAVRSVQDRIGAEMTAFRRGNGKAAVSDNK